MAEGAVEGGEFGGEAAERPAVGDDMVLGDEQEMLTFAQAQQAPADQRAVLEVKRRIGFGTGMPGDGGGLVGWGGRRQVVGGQLEAAGGGGDVLPGFATVGQEGGAQGFMAGDEAVEGGLEGGAVELALKAQPQGDVVGLAGGGVEAGDEPEPLLRPGQGDGLATVTGRDGRQGAAGGGGGGLGERREHGVVEQGAQRQFNAEGLAQPRHELHGKQGMPAEFKEMVMAPDLGDVQQFLPDLGDGGFGGALRGLVGAAGGASRVGFGQRLAVELAVGGEREAFQGDVGGGQHVVGQLRGEPGAQVRRVGGVAGVGDEVGDQAQVARPVITGVVTGEDGGLAHAGTAAQLRLDFAELDAEAPELDLEVVAAKVINGAVGQPAAEVAGLVQARRLAVARLPEGVGDEAPGGESGAVQVTPRRACAANVDFASDANGHGPQISI